MLSIGQFAQLGRVSHRMLRHWDASGLLVPAQVDPISGYRSYDPSQLHRLHRILALRGLGFSLEDISLILHQPPDGPRLDELLRTRLAEIRQDFSTALERLSDIERRLALIEKEHIMAEIEIVIKPLPSVRLASLSQMVDSQPEVGQVLGPMIGRVAAALGEVPHGMPIAQYRSLDQGLEVTAGFELSGPVPEDLEVAELQAASQAVCGIHLGSMETIHESWQAVHQEVLARGAVPDGPCREVYVRSQSQDQSDWVTELQQPFSKPDSAG